MEKVLRFFILLFFLSSLVSCSTISSVTALVGNSTMSTRGFSGSVEDTYLMSQIIKDISKLELKNFTNITVSVNDGNVLLTGNINSQLKRLELVQSVWKVDGVNEIYNEIMIDNSPSLLNRTEDWIFESRIKKRLLFKKGINSNNYNVDVVNGNVYVLGIASDITEKNEIDTFLKNMGDIKKLITIISLPKSSYEKNKKKL
ncbi:MAG: hypothetical protein CMP32_05215 [Rickettsiales bacterium]|nr:hypothetical protein [Rickettsiales bacterium]